MTISSNLNMKISVAMCTYNGEKFLKEQLESILLQSKPVDEIVICDDKSTDKTVTIIETFLKQYPKKITFYENENNFGAIKNFEKCIELCSGDIIFLSDQDDVWYKNKVEKLIGDFQKDEKALLIFSNGDLIDDNGNMLSGNLWEKWGFTKQQQNKWLNNTRAFGYLIRNDNKITGATVAFKKQLKPHILPFELPNNFWHDAWLGIIASGFNGLRLNNECTIKYRVHKNQQIGLGNGINVTTGDIKFSNYTSAENFLIRLSKKFPERSKDIFPRKHNIIKNTINKIKSLLYN